MQLLQLTATAPLTQVATTTCLMLLTWLTSNADRRRRCYWLSLLTAIMTNKLNLAAI